MTFTDYIHSSPWAIQINVGWSIPYYLRIRTQRGKSCDICNMQNIFNENTV